MKPMKRLKDWLRMDKVLCIDFDGTICDFDYPEMGEPKAGIKEAFQRLKDRGWTIHILSCRTNVELKKYPIDRTMQVREMKEYLDKHEIPYDEVLNKDKPLAVWYIDDRGISFQDNWDEIVKEILNDEQ